MIRSHNVLAVDEEPRAVVHIVFNKGHDDERKDEYDEVFHDASVGCISWCRSQGRIFQLLVSPLKLLRVNIP